jgi:dihydrofolate synthase/folylpolyglutamate synthase
VSLTYFEFGTLAALQLFAAARPDVVILEVGLGGRLDAVNLIDADVSLVSSVAIDHTAWLGETLGKIAREKAGIFRAGRPAIIGQPAPPPELVGEAERIGARVYLAGREFRWEPAPAGWRWYGPTRRRDALPPPCLRGGHQFDNAAAALMALDCLAERLPVSQAAVRAGLQRVRLPGRFQVVPGPVTLVLDVAHNEAAAQVLARNLEALPCSGTLHGVFGILGDKDAAGMARALTPRVTRWYLAAPRDARAVAALDLQRRLVQAGVAGACTCFPSVSAALAAARQTASAGDCILVFGSFVTVAEAMQWLNL